MCNYCEKAVPLVLGETNDFGIAIQHPNNLIAYGYDVHGSSSNGLEVKINFCPMCGKKIVLEEKFSRNRRRRPVKQVVRTCMQICDAVEEQLCPPKWNPYKKGSEQSRQWNHEYFCKILRFLDAVETIDKYDIRDSVIDALEDANYHRMVCALLIWTGEKTINGVVELFA